MMESRMEFGDQGNVGAVRRPKRLLDICRRLGLGVLVVLSSGAVLTSVWRVAADENRGQALAAVKALQSAQDSTGRVECIRDLVRSSRIDGQIVIPPLIRLLADATAEVRVEAARALGPATSAVALEGSDGPLARAAIAALQTSLDDPDPAVRIAAVYSLGAIAGSKDRSGTIVPQNLVDRLTPMLGDPDATVRGATIAALGVAGPVASPNPPPALIAAINDRSHFNRAACVRSLMRFDRGVDNRSIGTLLSIIENEPLDAPITEACVDVLYQNSPRLSAHSARSAVSAGLASTDHLVRLETVALLKRLAANDQAVPSGEIGTVK